MENRRSDDPGRRTEDDRWLKVQKDVVNLVTATREGQRSLAKLEIEVGKLSDHVEEVDDHLRGVAGKESLDARVAILEKEFDMHGVLLRRISDQCNTFSSTLQELRVDIQAQKIVKGVMDKTEGTQFARFKEWLTFGRAVVLAVIALIVPLATLVATNWEKFAPLFHPEKQTVQTLQRDIEKERRGPRGRIVRKKEAELEKAAEEHQ